MRTDRRSAAFYSRETRFCSDAGRAIAHLRNFIGLPFDLEESVGGDLH